MEEIKLDYYPKTLKDRVKSIGLWLLIGVVGVGLGVLAGNAIIALIISIKDSFR